LCISVAASKKDFEYMPANPAKDRGKAALAFEIAIVPQVRVTEKPDQIPDNNGHTAHHLH